MHYYQSIYWYKFLSVQTKRSEPHSGSKRRELYNPNGWGKRSWNNTGCIYV